MSEAHDKLTPRVYKSAIEPLDLTKSHSSLKFNDAIMSDSPITAQNGLTLGLHSR